jgi:hypothetical protein
MRWLRQWQKVSSPAVVAQKSRLFSFRIKDADKVEREDDAACGHDFEERIPSRIVMACWMQQQRFVLGLAMVFF